MNDHEFRPRYGACSCLPCRAAYSRYVSERCKERKQGRLKGNVSAAPVRRHVKRFRNLRDVSEVIGVSECTLSRIKRGYLKKVRPETAQMILNFDPKTPLRKPEFVAAAPVRRIVQRLRRQGFSLELLGKRNGLKSRLRLSGKKVRRKNAERIKRYYEMIMAGAAA